MTNGLHITATGRVLLRRLLVAVLGVLLGLLAIVVLKPETWRDVLAGLVIGWSTSVCIWAFGSYRARREEAYQEVRKAAELDLLLARFNQLAAQCGAPLIRLDEGVDPILHARMERLAHFMVLDEFRHDLFPEGGYQFWDEVALGTQSDGSDSERLPRGMSDDNRKDGDL